MLRRYTGLNHLAQAARTVLQNKPQVNKMYQDLCKVDFVHIQVILIEISAVSLLIGRHHLKFVYVDLMAVFLVFNALNEFNF